ncbi:unnamed protein product [Closterium sp. NIES-53]
MAAQELRWLTYLLADLGEPPRSPPVLTKHIALRYFLARELQQRGQLRLAYVASEANTADIFTKALPPGDHQRFCTMLACFDLLDWSCDLLFSPTLPMGLRLAYVASEANTADIFTKALPPGDHQRFCTMLACFDLLDWSCDLLFSPTLPMGGPSPPPPSPVLPVAFPPPPAARRVAFFPLLPVESRSSPPLPVESRFYPPLPVESRLPLPPSRRTLPARRPVVPFPAARRDAPSPAALNTRRVAPARRRVPALALRARRVVPTPTRPLRPRLPAPYALRPLPVASLRPTPCTRASPCPAPCAPCLPAPCALRPRLPAPCA